MANDETRQDVVEENIENTEAQYGPENWQKLLAVCLKDISVSLAMLVDKSGS
jgi:hypothetical protein